MERDPKKGPARKAAVVEDAAPSAKFLQGTPLTKTWSKFVILPHLTNVLQLALLRFPPR